MKASGLALYRRAACLETNPNPNPDPDPNPNPSPNPNANPSPNPNPYPIPSPSPSPNPNPNPNPNQALYRRAACLLSRPHPALGRSRARCIARPPCPDLRWQRPRWKSLPRSRALFRGSSLSVGGAALSQQTPRLALNLSRPAPARSRARSPARTPSPARSLRAWASAHPPWPALGRLRRIGG